MSLQQQSREELLDGLALAADGKGPLLQRDYWAVIACCRASPSGLIEILRHKFIELVPWQLARFERLDDNEAPLEVGDELRVNIRGAGAFGVRIVHRDRQSFTIGTMQGHPETGRVTFGAYRNPRNDVIFHIRSRARSSSGLRYLSYLTGGEPMQTSTWCELINRVAATTGDGTIGFIQACTAAVEDDDGDRDVATPTFRAVGD